MDENDEVYEEKEVYCIVTLKLTSEEFLVLSASMSLANIAVNNVSLAKKLDDKQAKRYCRAVKDIIDYSEANESIVLKLYNIATSKLGIKSPKSAYCRYLRDKDNPLYPQGCQLGNATSPLWCEQKERCCYFEKQEVKNG
jgi:hypothetical protein